MDDFEAVEMTKGGDKIRDSFRGASIIPTGIDAKKGGRWEVVSGRGKS